MNVLTRQPTELINNIYFDHNASTAMAPEVAGEMLPWMTACPGFGNPARPHWAGAPAKKAVETARAQVGDLIGASAEEMVFTSGGSESVNHAIKGLFFAFFNEPNRRHIITSEVEHPCARSSCQFLRDTFGAEVTEIPVNNDCVVDVDAIRQAIRPDTLLVNIIHASHEVGTIQPIEEISELTREKGVFLHVDATCSVGKNEVDVSRLGCDLLSFSGHKFYGPKGVGALYVSNKIRQGTIGFESLIHGSAPRHAYRSGTVNVPAVIGMGKACELAGKWNTQSNRQTLRGLTEYFWKQLQIGLGNRVVLNGPADHQRRICNTLNVSFVGQQGEDVLSRLPRVAASSGPKTEDVIRAMGCSDDVVRGAVRFSLGKKSTVEEVDAAVDDLVVLLGK